MTTRRRLARVTLRRAAHADLAAVKALGEDTGAEPSSHESRLYIVARRETGHFTGFVRISGEPPNGVTEIRRVVIVPTLRGWGYGSEAVRLAEKTSPADTYVARVEPGHGLNLYFWLRLGYRPARSGEVPWPSPDGDGIITMIRRKQQ